jgi:hypothetical protein
MLVLEGPLHVFFKRIAPKESYLEIKSPFSPNEIKKAPIN